ncbi:MAG: tetratricopeptide repeat protein [Bacteroidota bacterium]|nr:tetratricopeptide repeat protein [Bacteroidota bacterium]
MIQGVDAGAMISGHQGRIRKFNPGAFQDDSDLVEQFVVRQFEFETIVSILQDNSESDSCQHIMVVASRGRGKTMLLARTAAELRSRDELARKLFPVRFMEESLEVFHMADFWLDALYYLAAECARRDLGLARELRGRHANLCKRWRSQDLELHARAAVLDAADRLGRRLVLMVENFQALLQDVNEDFGWKLRQILQTEPQIMLVGSATSQFRGLTDAEAPFFDFFRVLELKPLNTQDCQRLWTNITGESVEERLIRPLEILTGGSPRLLAIVAGFNRHKAAQKLMEDLVRLVDERTEYFRGCLKVLARTERRVFLAVIDLWQPSTASEVRDRARLDIRTVSTMLGRLVDRGAVIRTGKGRKRLYAATEGLFSIYYKLRRDRDEAGAVEYLVRSMAAFYGNPERQADSGSRIEEAVESKTVRQAASRILEDIPELADAVAESATVLQDAASLFNRGSAAQSEGDLATASAAYGEVIDRFGNSKTTAVKGYVAVTMFAQATVKLELKEFVSARSVCKDTIVRFECSDESFGQWAVAYAFLIRGHIRQATGDVKLAMQAWQEVINRFGNSDQAGLHWPVCRAMVFKAQAHYDNNDPISAVAGCDRLIRRFGKSHEPNLQGAIAEGLMLKGAALEQSGRLDSAIEAYAEIVNRFDHHEQLSLQEWAFDAHMAAARLAMSTGRSERAHASCSYLKNRLTAVDGVSLSARILGKGVSLFVDLGKPQLALDTFRSLLERFSPHNESSTRDIVNLVIAMLAGGVSARGLVNILSGSAASAAIGPLLIAVRMEAGETVRAPRELLAVARDILRQVGLRRENRGAARNDAEGLPRLSTV